MNHIKILRNTKASGNSLSRGEILEIDREIRPDDANILVRLGKAVLFEKPRPKKKESVTS